MNTDNKAEAFLNKCGVYPEDFLSSSCYAAVVRAMDMYAKQMAIEAWEACKMFETKFDNDYPDMKTWAKQNFKTK